MQRRSGSLRSSASLATVVFDLHDITILDDDDDDEIEALDEETIIELEPDATQAIVVRTSRYPPGLADDELHALVGRLTQELCRRVPRASV